MSFARILPGLGALLLTAASVTASGQAEAQSAAEFFRGKNVSIVIGFGAGGGYDTYARVLARHYGRHIPGNPNVVPRNMPGAGALIAANHIWAAAPKDGTEMAIVGASTLMEPLLGNQQAQFDAAKYTWIGSMSKDIAFCALGKAAGVKTFEEWVKSGKEMTFAATGPAAITYQHPQIFSNVLGAKAKPLAGYAGTKEGSLALQRGEVHGLCGMFVSSVQSQYQSLVDSGEMILVIQAGPETTDVFGKVPSVYDFAKSDLDRQVLDIHFGQLLLGRPFIAPPGVPQDRAKALQEGFMAALNDPQLLEDAKKTRISIEPVSAQQARDLLQKFANFPPEGIEAAKKAIGR